jgi:ABC-2 type transport system permease protein
MVILWRAAYEGISQIGGYTPSQMMLYYVGLTTLQTLLTSHPEWDISYEIRMGEFSRHLLRPLRFNTYHLIGEIAWKGLRCMFITPVLIGALLWLGTGIFSAITLKVMTLPSFLMSLVMSYILAYFLKVSLGLTAFWVMESYGIIILFDFFRTFFAGIIIPLDLMPSSIRVIGERLPFAYLYFFPLSILRGKIEGGAILKGLIIQAGWCMASYLLMKTMYHLGVKKYSAVGG